VRNDGDITNLIHWGKFLPGGESRQPYERQE
jgi:hypothetical protein